MNQPVRLAVNGAAGRMGNALLALLADDTRFALRGAVVDSASSAVGDQVLGAPALQLSAQWDAMPELDVVVDFSTPDGLSAALDYCTDRRIALVSGTTGVDAALRQRLEVAAQRIAVLRADNFSLGIAVLTRLLREAAATLPSWDLEIVEAHHAHKTDAPSGTSLALGRAAATARGVDFDSVAVTGRAGQRRVGDIGFASLRGGDIVGEHSALLCTAGERLELSHRASDRGIFAHGALAAAAWIVDRPPGTYAIEDILAPRRPA